MEQLGWAFRRSSLEGGHSPSQSSFCMRHGIWSVNEAPYVRHLGRTLGVAIFGETVEVRACSAMALLGRCSVFSCIRGGTLAVWIQHWRFDVIRLFRGRFGARQGLRLVGFGGLVFGLASSKVRLGVVALAGGVHRFCRLSFSSIRLMNYHGGACGWQLGWMPWARAVVRSSAGRSQGGPGLARPRFLLFVGEDVALELHKAIASIGGQEVATNVSTHPSAP